MAAVLQNQRKAKMITFYYPAEGCRFCSTPTFELQAPSHTCHGRYLESLRKSETDEPLYHALREGKKPTILLLAEMLLLQNNNNNKTTLGRLFREGRGTTLRDGWTVI